MKHELKISQILDFYDVPVIFVARNEIDTNYLCLLVSTDSQYPQYIAVALSKIRLSEFLAGRLDLRDAFEKPELNEWLWFEYKDNLIIAESLNLETLPEEYLPESDYFHEVDSEGEDIIIAEANALGKPIVHLSISDHQDRQSISAVDLSSVLFLYQLFLEYSLKKLNKSAKRTSRLEESYTLRAFDSSPGSFNIHLFSDTQLDLFGTSQLDLALHKFDEIANEFSTDIIADFPGSKIHVDDDAFLSSLRQIKGHAITSYTKLLKKIVDSNLRIKHKWYSPGSSSVHHSSIDKAKAENIYSYLTKSRDLGTELRTFEGYFVQVDVVKGTWRLLNSEDNKPYNGTASSEILQGITIETQAYKIDCEEVLEEVVVSQKEKTNFKLTSITLVDSGLSDLPY